MAKAEQLREELSFRAYAKTRKVSHTAVNNAVRDGRLKECLVKRGRRILIDRQTADREWDQKTDPMKAHEPEERAGGVPAGTRPANSGRKKQPGLYGEETQAQAPAEEGKKPDPKAIQPSEILEVRRGYLKVQAELAQLELEERRGTMVRANEVRVAIFKLARDAQAALLLIPNRITPMLAAETDPHAIRQMLTQEILQALEGLSGVNGGQGG